MIQSAALLLTDIVDSTQLTERLGDDAMSELWSGHDRVSRALLSVWRGVEVNRSDGFLLRFQSVDDAAAYAVSYHAALRELPIPLRARAGIHIGSVIARPNEGAHADVGPKPSEIAGLAISMVSRAMSLALPGQTLVTTAARAAVARTDLRIESHGFWRLKGVEQPIELFEVGDASAPFAPPVDVAKAHSVVLRGQQWLPRRELPSSVPNERNSFVGRHPELAELAGLVAEHQGRLVSIVGIGGTGKTRLAQHFAWRRIGDFSGGAWFCDLSQATTFDGLCGAVAQGLGVPLGQSDPVEQIGNAISGRGRCLVILDNFEQVTAFGAQSLGRWMDQTVDAVFVVTTRNVLGLDGEIVMSLAPLSKPDSAELFRVRARAARSGFVLDAKDGRLLTELVDLLDGLPLAIELAAARVRVLSIAGMLERMRERFSLLTSSHGRPTRQATLKATLDWSWDLLAAWERLALAQLAVFEGGFGLKAFEAVVDSGQDAHGRNAVEILQSLVDKSWVRRIDEDRFTLLNSVQQYAALQLVELDPARSVEPEAPFLAYRRHWRFFGALDEAVACENRCIEIDNLVAATRRAIAAGCSAEAGACLLASWWALRRCGPFRVAVELGKEIRALPGLTTLNRARVEFVIGNAWRHMGMRDAARVALEVADAAAVEAGAGRERSWILAAIGEEQTYSRQTELAERSFRSALALARALGDQSAEAAILSSLGALLQESDRAEASIAPYLEALALASALGDRHLEGGIVGNLGVACYSLGRLDEAAQNYEAAIVLSRAAGNRRWVGNMRSNLGLLLLERGEIERAKAELVPALEDARQLGHLRLECTTAWNLGLACRAGGDHEAAVRYFTAALGTAERIDDAQSQGELRALIDATNRETAA